ncbi:MAG: hypothetical protein GEU90_08410 [Gemmatimonas sp.]|nr:hypothetical protein [Gemmatimonas sp.]
MQSLVQRALGLTGASVLGLMGLIGCAGSTTASGAGEVLASAAPAAADVHANAPTWYADVLPIVAENCADCHQPQGKNMGGMVAPFSLLTYEEAEPWAAVMALRVAEGAMPPWDAHPTHEGTFVGERYLSEEAKQTIAAWAEAGAPEGDPADAPANLASAEEVEQTGEWWIGEPDLVLAFGEPYHVEDEASDVNIDVNLDVPESYTEPRWIKSSEMRAGSEHVHHICGEPFGCIAPGWDPYVYPEGFAMLLPPVDEIALGMHYNKATGAGTAFDDVSRAAMVFYEDGETIRHIVKRSVLAVGFDFVIPAGHPEYSLSLEFPFEEDTYILSVTPHMHYRGKQAKYELVYPDGRTELLLWVPEYDFEWQRMYVFKDPPIAPAGSKLVWTPTWDNSSDNPGNPDPTVDVPYGEPTVMEMGNGWLDYAAVEPIEHVVGQDPIPQDYLAEVTEQLDGRANRQRPRRAVLIEPGESRPSSPNNDSN